MLDLILTSVAFAGVGYGLYNRYVLGARERELHKLAYYDVLTGLANRLHFGEIAPKILEKARTSDSHAAVFLIDLDGFKAVNDAHGHAIGDAFLKDLSQRLSKFVDDRSPSNDDGIAARLGGDEFVLLFRDIGDAQEAAEIAKALFKAFEPLVVIEQTEIPANISVGISLYPFDGSTVSSLLKAADLALYTAKDAGKNTFYFHERRMSTKFERLYELQSTIKYFIETDDFSLRYQPIVDAKTQAVKSVEVLFAGNKLNYPNLNIQEMMTVAEQDVDIITLGEMILRKACQQYVEHLSHIITDDEFMMYVNVSATQLDDKHFVAMVTKVLEETGMSPHRLGLELTETVIMLNFKDAIIKIDTLKKLGVKFSIDDFGKGYSSMSYLRRLNVHKLKIDKSFIDNMRDKKALEIVKTIVMMAKTLGIVSVAEGVETAGQFKFLKSIDCDLIQGYIISPPVSIQDLVDLKGFIS